MMHDPRCGACAPCRATPPRPCDRWVAAAIAKLRKELQSPEMAAVLRAFDEQYGEPKP